LASAGTVAQAGPIKLIGDPIVSLDDATWSARPTDVQLNAAKPPGVASRGYVILKCGAGADGRLTDCAPMLEDPRGQGFGAAALSLVPDFRIEARAARFAHEAGARVSVEFTWGGDSGPCYPPNCSFIPPPPPPPAPQ
jgi:hypothetical protein